MEFRRCTIGDSHEAEGVVVVIDVLRAFTTAAWAFHREAREIVLATTVEEALALRDRTAGALTMGEVNALPIDEFDLPNSPAAVAATDLRARRLIHRTTAGTQGARRARGATHLFAASLVVAGATAAHIRALDPALVSFVETGRRAGDSGDEDVACADYLEGLLKGATPDRDEVRRRVLQSPAGRRFASVEQAEYPAEDLALALELDRFDFAMTARRAGGELTLVRAGPVGKMQDSGPHSRRDRQS